MKIKLTREEFDLLADTLDYLSQDYTRKLNEMFQDLNLYNEKREKHYKEIAESARKLYNEKFEPIYYQENAEALKEEEK